MFILFCLFIPWLETGVCTWLLAFYLKNPEKEKGFHANVTEICFVLFIIQHKCHKAWLISDSCLSLRVMWRQNPTQNAGKDVCRCPTLGQFTKRFHRFLNKISWTQLNPWQKAVKDESRVMVLFYFIYFYTGDCEINVEEPRIAVCICPYA